MYALNVSRLTKTYPNGTEALKGVDLKVNQGDFFALLGANGAGKSTMINLVTSLLTKTSGQVSINGHNLEKQPAAAKLSLGVVPQEINLNAFETCRQILIAQAGYYGVKPHIAKPRVDALLKQLGLWDKRYEITRHLSGGMKRRLMVARALIHEPPLLLLDEPTAGVDIEIRRSMWDFLKQLNNTGTTIVLTTHYLEEAEQLCNHIAIIDQGTIVKDCSMSALLQTINQQTLILSTAEPIHVLPELDGLAVEKIDANTFELCIQGNISMNQAFTLLTEQGIIINNIRNKTNRLEELFLNIISKKT